MALVIGRWLIGFAFSKHDLDLLDDPIPDSLYCWHCRRDRELAKVRLSDAEEGSRDTITDSYDMVDGCKQLDVISVDTASNGSINEAP